MAAVGAGQVGLEEALAGVDHDRVVPQQMPSPRFRGHLVVGLLAVGLHRLLVLAAYMCTTTVSIIMESKRRKKKKQSKKETSNKERGCNIGR